jgi:hypothetical protein
VTADNLTDIYVVLIETDGTNYEVINTTELDGNGAFSFGEMPKPSSGEAYVVAAAKRTYNDDYSSSLKFDEAIDVMDSNISIPTLVTEDFATGLSAVANTAN